MISIHKIYTLFNELKTEEDIITDYYRLLQILKEIAAFRKFVTKL